MKKLKFNKDRLKRIMSIAGITQIRLAEITGVSRQAMSQFIQGQIKPNDKNIEIIAKEFNIPILFFYVESAELEQYKNYLFEVEMFRRQIFEIKQEDNCTYQLVPSIVSMELALEDSKNIVKQLLFQEIEQITEASNKKKAEEYRKMGIAYFDAHSNGAWLNNY